MTRRVVVAPDSFKGTLSAADAAEAIRDGWLLTRPDDEVLLRPMADGGEGTLDTLLRARSDGTRHGVDVPGPDGRQVHAVWGMFGDGTAVVELAATSGLGLLDEPRPRTAHTRGFGRAIVSALDAGAERLLLATGGSASTDGGAGVLRELSARLLDAQGREVPDGGAGLGPLTRIDLSGLRAMPPGGVRVLTDVRNPLLGPRGAAAVYGPQKGATVEDVAALEAGLTALAALLPADTATPGAGAAGGTAFGLLGWGAELVPGAREVARWIGLAEALDGAVAVITGEGRFDLQTAEGKVPAVVAELSSAAGVPALLVAGAIDAPVDGFTGGLSLGDLVGPAAARSDPVRALRRAGAILARVPLSD